MNKDLDTVISLFEKNYKKSKTYISLQQDKTFKQLSSEELSLIMQNSLIFFQASKSRIVLVHWICKYVREIFEKYDFSDIDIPTETYETVREKFGTKAFNRTEFCKLFNCDKNTTLSYEDFIELEQKYITEYNSVVEEKNKLSSITHIAIKKKVQKPNLIKEYNDIIKDDKQKKVLLLRGQGKTLDEVGSEIKVTRERVRQIEMKPKTAICKWANINAIELKETLCDNDIVNNKKLEKLLGKDNVDIIKYAISTTNIENNVWFYIKTLDTVIYDEKSEFIDLLNAKVEEIKDSGDKSLTDFINIFKEAGYDFFAENIVEDYLKSNNLNIFDNKIHFGKMTIAKAVALVSSQLPDKKIRITNKKELEEFAKLINQNYDLGVKAGRALSTRIQDILVMVDKATYSPVESIVISDDLINKITEYVQEMESDRISYSALYDIFEEELVTETNIDNQYGLHGILKHYEESKDYLCLRYYICKKEISNVKSKSYFEKLAIILKENGPMTIDEIIKKIPEWNNMYIKYATIYYPEIVQWNTTTYINLATVKMSEKEKATITEIVETSLDNKYKYTSSYIIYNKITKQLPEFVKNNNITDEKQLYYIIQYMFSDKYKFRKPHILNNSDITESFTTDDLVKLITGKGKVLDKKELIENLTTYYGPKNSSLSLSLQRVLSDYVRIGQNQYVLKTRINLSEKDVKVISEQLNRFSIQGKVIIAGNITDFSEFPKIDFKWNAWLLCGIIDKYDFKYKKVLGANNSSQHSIVPIVKSDSTFKDKNDVIDWLLENDFKQEKTEENIYNYIKSLGIYYTNLTKEEILKKTNK